MCFGFSAHAQTLDDAYWRWAAKCFSHAVASDPAKKTTVWGETADPDGDGIRNLLDYTANTDPTTPTTTSDVWMTFG